MFIFNLKLNNNKIFKIALLSMLIIVLVILFIILYNTFSSGFKVKDSIDKNQVFEITSDNYTNILQAVNNDIDSYVGCKIHFTGYIYRLLDFSDEEFVLARNMIISDDGQSLIVGFLCSSKDSINYTNGDWVDVTGEIVKGDYHGDIAIIKVSNMFEIEKPSNEFVSPPDDTYIPTSNMF